MKSVTESLNGALRRMGYTTKWGKGTSKNILNAEGQVVLNAARPNEVWDFLRDQGYEPLDVPPVMVFLQNAWSPLYAGREWPRLSWLHALSGSRSGKRLKMLGLPWDCYRNTTPIVGARASSVVAPDPAHVATLLETPGLALVVACGKQAEASLIGSWRGPLLAIPHPAARVVTNALYERASALIAEPLTDRVALRQGRGKISKEQLK